MLVHMPVEVLCESCLTCATLKLKDRSLYVSSVTSPLTEMVHSFECEHLQGCQRVQRILEKEAEDKKKQEN